MTVCGGYFVTRAVERPAYVSSDLLPPRIFSLSECICDFVPDVWAVEWARVSPEDRMTEASKVGIEAATLPEVISWATRQMNTGNIGWPRVFLASHDARAFATRFLPRDSASSCWESACPQALWNSSSPNRLLGRRWGPGVYKAVSNRVGLESGGAVLGWEVLCYDYGGFHSWLCNGLEGDVAEKYGIRPNEAGFITSAPEASVAAEYCSRQDVGAEPGFWAPWLVVEYALFPEMAT